MSISRFVRPETVTLSISNGDTITVRKRLTAGEQRAMFARMYADGATPARLNTLEVGLAMVVTYLLDWTLVDEDGVKVPIVGLTGDELAAILDNLGADDFTEIKDAIDAHMEIVAAEKKRTSAGATVSSATSQSAA